MNPSAPRDRSSPLPLVAYYTRHDGTLWDWMEVARRVGSPARYNWVRMNPET